MIVPNRSSPTQILPLARYLDLRLPDGKLVGRYDPARGMLEITRAGQRHYFDLTQLVIPIASDKPVCYDT